MSNTRYLFEISYNGTLFHGSQKQCDSITVFGLLERLLCDIFDQKINCIPCGRTDSGVHAYQSFCHCDFQFSFNKKKIMNDINRHSLNKGLIIRAITTVDNAFHALLSVNYRTYKYFFTFDKSLPHYFYHSVSLIYTSPLFIPTKCDCEGLLLGSRNFLSLCNYSSDVNTFIKDVKFIDIENKQYLSLFDSTHDVFCLTISANGFIYKMVRHIAGLLIHCMVNFKNMDLSYDYFMANCPINYKIAPVQGLHLHEVDYNRYTIR